MVLKKLQVLKKKSEVIEVETYSTAFIVGSDIFTLQLSELLKHTFDIEDINICLTIKKTINDFRFKGPSMFRGADNLKLLSNYSKDNIEELKSYNSVFYRDQKLRDFGGRAQSEKLLDGEKFFTQKHFIFDRDDFSENSHNSFVSEKIVSIEHSSGEDLVEPVNWKVKCASGRVFNCKYLFWGDSPNDFINLCKEYQKDKILLEYGATFLNKMAMVVSYNLKNQVTDDQKTYFIPLSLTYDWGHFIGEFSADLKQNIFKAEFLHFLDSENCTEDELGKYLRTLRKYLDKIFVGFSNNVLEEKIYIAENYPISSSGGIFENIAQLKLGDMYFFGSNGPLFKDMHNLDLNLEKISHYARGIYNLKQFEAIFKERL